MITAGDVTVAAVLHVPLGESLCCSVNVGVEVKLLCENGTVIELLVDVAVPIVTVTVHIWPVADYGALSCQVTLNLLRGRTLEYATNPAIGYIRCWHT